MTNGCKVLVVGDVDYEFVRLAVGLIRIDFQSSLEYDFRLLEYDFRL